MPTTIEALASALAHAISERRRQDVEACDLRADAERRAAASHREERAAARALALEKAIANADAESNLDALVQLLVLSDRVEAMHAPRQDEHTAETHRIIESVLGFLARSSGRSPADLGLDWYYQRRRRLLSPSDETTEANSVASAKTKAVRSEPLAELVERRITELIGANHAEALGASRLSEQCFRPRLEALAVLVRIIDYAIEDAERRAPTLQ